MKYKVGDEVRVKRTNKETMYKHIEGTTVLILNNVCGDLYTVFDCVGGQWVLDEEMLEPIAPTLSKVKDGKIDCIVHTRTQEEANILCKELGSDLGWHRPANECWQYHNKDTWYIIQNGLVHQFGDEDCRLAYPSMPTCEFSDLFATGGTLPTSEWSKLIFENGSSIEALPQKDDAVRGENHFCTGFRGGKIPTCEMKGFAAPYLDLSVFLNNGISAKNGGKNSMKFTFYTVEGYRMDKSNNTKIPTVTTEVVYKDKDGCATGGSATCDKTDYNSRQGVLEALANMCCGGNFDREYNKAVKDNARADKISRTCTYCGQLFDTVAEKEAHEAWHVERRKARHERYLLRKRAKEITFEEQAQKMAKEMMGEQK